MVEKVVKGAITMADSASNTNRTSAWERLKEFSLRLLDRMDMGTMF
jgi:hypothetical protein